MTLWHPLLLDMQDRMEEHPKLNTCAYSSDICDLWAPDAVVHAGGQDSVACERGEEGTGGTATVTVQFTHCRTVPFFQMAQVIDVHKTKRKTK